VVGLGQAQVADRLGDGLLGLGDRVRVVAHHLVEHLLRVLGLVEQRVDVRLRQLGDASEDGLFLCHVLSSADRRPWCGPHPLDHGPPRKGVATHGGEGKTTAVSLAQTNLQVRV